MFALRSKVPRSEAARSNNAWSVRSDVIMSMIVCKQRHKKMTTMAMCKQRLSCLFLLEQMRKAYAVQHAVQHAGQATLQQMSQKAST